MISPGSWTCLAGKHTKSFFPLAILCVISSRETNEHICWNPKCRKSTSRLQILSPIFRLVVPTQGGDHSTFPSWELFFFLFQQHLNAQEVFAMNRYGLKWHHLTCTCKALTDIEFAFQIVNKKKIPNTKQRGGVWKRSWNAEGEEGLMSVSVVLHNDRSKIQSYY